MSSSHFNTNKATGLILSRCSFFKIGASYALRLFLDLDVMYHDYDEELFNDFLRGDIDVIVIYLANDPESVISTISSLDKLRGRLGGTKVIIVSDLSYLWVTETIMNFIGAKLIPSHFYFVRKKNLNDLLTRDVIEYESVDYLAGEYFKEFNVNTSGVIAGLSLEEMSCIKDIFKFGKGKYNANNKFSRSTYYRHISNAIAKTRKISREFACVLPKERNYSSFVSSMENNFENYFLKSLSANDIFPYYQPIITHEGNLYGFELLCRWKVNDVVQTPSLFFHKLTSSLVWQALTLKFIEIAVCNIVECSGNHYFSVNIPNILMNNELFFDSCINICSFIKEKGWVNRLILEVSEETVFDKSNCVIITLQRLMEFGCQVFLDDCFSDSSSLFPVKNIVFSGYKIDKSIIDSFSANKNHLSLIKTMVHYCNLVGSVCVAEGIDSNEKLLVLKKENVCFFQGYHISIPINYQDMKSMIVNCSIES
ncbi:hypothetical protein ASE99_23610 [Serratia sp. Leaf51]|nr:hypothetical protein ASE99_23610 [Serratia sp. Leaf51]